MSIFHPARLICGACATPCDIERSASVNADRRPDLRAAILDGSFQAIDCVNCAAPIRIEPHLTYMDMHLGLWVVAAAASELEEWPAMEAEARDTYDRAFGAGAPPSGRDLGDALLPRLVFGWPAFREKLHCATLGLDDVTLELLKMAILRNVPGPAMADATELRLVGGTPDSLDFVWVVTETEALLSALSVPRDIYEGIADDEAWITLRERFAGALLVDLRRFVAGPEVAEAA